MCPAEPRVSQMEIKLATSSVTCNHEESDLGPCPDITLSPRRERSRASPRIHIQPQGEDPESRSDSTSKPEEEASRPSLSPIITTRVFYEDSRLHWIQLSTKISHVPNASPFSVEAVTNGSGYPDMIISTIKYRNMSSY